MSGTVPQTRRHGGAAPVGETTAKDRQDVVSLELRPTRPLATGEYIGGPVRFQTRPSRVLCPFCGEKTGLVPTRIARIASRVIHVVGEPDGHLQRVIVRPVPNGCRLHLCKKCHLTYAVPVGSNDRGEPA